MAFFRSMTLPLPLPPGASDDNTPATPWNITRVDAGGPEPWTLTITWSIATGRAETADIQLHSETGHIPHTALRAVPTILRVAREIPAKALESHGAVIASYGDHATAAPFIAAAAASRKARPGPGRPADIQQLHDAARAWNDAPEGRKRAAVAAATCTTPSGAAKLIARARKAGLLDP